MMLRNTNAIHRQSFSQPGFTAQLRALKAIIHRHWTIFRRYPSWVLALIIWPVLFPAAYLLIARALAGPDGNALTIFNQATGTSDYVGYIAIGATIYMWQNIVLWEVGFALREEQLRGTLEANWLSPTWRFSYLLGQSLTQLAVALLLLLVAALEFGLLFGVRLNGSPGLVLLMILAAIPAIYGLGIAFASLVIAAKEANAFVYLVRGIVMIFCGITFPIAILPNWMQTAAAWLPQTYIIAGVRKAALGGVDFGGLLPDLVPLLLLGLLWLALGYISFNWMERRARQTGAIGHY